MAGHAGFKQAAHHFRWMLSRLISRISARSFTARIFRVVIKSAFILH
jgi:hypothetical protein